jgi:DNA invertase Pin-like site-specific DNA recombinase
MDRLARNLGDLLRIVADLTGRKVRVEFVKEALTFTGEDSPMATLMLSIMGAVAAFERSMILERQREGVALAKKAGKYLGRAPAIRANNGKLAELTRLLSQKTPIAEMARQLNVSRQTIYSQLAAQKQEIML